MATPFPTGLALGETFINRTKERKYLSQRVSNTQHTVLMAPRRYGKTSLVVKVSEEMALPYRMVDLFPTASEEEVRNLIADKVGELIFELSNNVEKTKKIIFKVFKAMNPEVVLGALGLKLQITFTKNPADDITKLLLNLDEVASQVKEKAVLFIDEFQQISELKEFHKLEASIRHAVERSNNITYIFSGSNKHLLSKMFGDDSRPLYKLCHIMELDRITATHYDPYLKEKSQERWGEILSSEMREKIYELTDCHPFYVNMLCQLLWEEEYPSLDTIEDIWSGYINTQRHFIGPTISNLSMNQRKMLKALAASHKDEALSIAFLAPMKLSASSAQQALEYLQKKGIIQKELDGSYSVLDPAIKYYLKK